MMTGLVMADRKRRAYAAIEKIHFENAYYRREIASKGLSIDNVS